MNSPQRKRTLILAYPGRKPQCSKIKCRITVKDNGCDMSIAELDNVS